MTRSRFAVLIETFHANGNPQSFDPGATVTVRIE